MSAPRVASDVVGFNADFSFVVLLHIVCGYGVASCTYHRYWRRVLFCELTLQEVFWRVSAGHVSISYRVEIWLKSAVNLFGMTAI